MNFKITGKIVNKIDKSTAYHSIKQVVLSYEKKFNTKVDLFNIAIDFINSQFVGNYEVGDLVEVEFWIKSNEWNGKFYTSLAGVYIQYADGRQYARQPQQQMPMQPQVQQQYVQQQQPVQQPVQQYVVQQPAQGPVQQVVQQPMQPQQQYVQQPIQTPVHQEQANQYDDEKDLPF